MESLIGACLIVVGVIMDAIITIVLTSRNR